MCGQVWWPILGICPLHLTHPSAHSQQWTHTRSSGQPFCGARGAVGGSVPCSRVSPQSWYWRWREHLLFTPPTDNPCRTWESNLQPLGYKSNSLTIRPRLPLRNKLIYILDGLRVSTFSANFFIFGWTIPSTFTHFHVAECPCCSFQSVPYMYKSYALILRCFFLLFGDWQHLSQFIFIVWERPKTSHLILCFTEERKSFGFEMHDMNHRIFIFGWTIPLHLIDFWVNNLFKPLVCPRITKLESY